MRKYLGLVLLAGLTSVSTTAIAQTTAIESRVDRLEREMRAVQRKVFPGGTQFVQPDNAAPDTLSPAPGSPASSPLTDLSARVTALETQLSSLTGQVEQAQFRQRQMEAAFDAYKRATDQRLATLEAGGSAVPLASAPATYDPAPSPGPTNLLPSSRPPASAATKPPVTPASATKPPVTTPASTSGDPARAKAVAAIERPSTGDGAEDGYIYGFRLWTAKYYPEAEAALKDVVAKYPTSKRASYAQNLLGRSYLDEGRPSLASIAFYDNYKKMPNGDRAPESLYYLASALMKLNKPADACKVYGELSDVYKAKITPEMAANIAKGRAAASCK